MKIKNLIIAAFSVVMLASCGGSDLCHCSQVSLDMMKEMKSAGADMTKMTAIQEKYKSDIEACEKMGEEMDKLSDEEKKAKEKEMESCPAYKELEKMMKEEMGG